MRKMRIPQIFTLIRIVPYLSRGFKSKLGKYLCIKYLPNHQSGWLDSNQRPHAPQTRTLTGLSYTPKLLKVGLLGLEPRKTGPESVVLPLHHSPKVNVFSVKTSFIKKLGYSDSNQEKQDQNLLCYHYTIAQNLILVIPSRFDAAKVQLFHNIPSISPFFFKRNLFFLHFSLILAS